MIDITPIINAFIALLASVITIIIVPQIRRLLIERVGNAQTQMLMQWIDIFVGAAEQMYAIPADKKNYVVEKLTELGYTVSPEIDGAIEAAVLQLHNSLKDY